MNILNMESLYSMALRTYNYFYVGNENQNSKEDLINTQLPDDILKEIFSLLEQSSLDQMNLVNHSWSDRCVNIKKKEFDAMKKLSDFLDENFFSKVIEEISDNEKQSDFFNLTSLLRN